MEKLLIGLVLTLVLAACNGSGNPSGSGSTNLVFSNPTGSYNGSTTTLTGNTTLVGILMISDQGSGANKRNLVTFLPLNSRVAGTTYPITTTTGAGVTYNEGDPSTGKAWSASGGSIRVAVKSGRTLTFELIDVVLSKRSADTSPSAGTITVNGTISGESVTPL